jgi:hypothetical protein
LISAASVKEALRMALPKGGDKASAA